jgi:hypothetical protein
MRHMSKVMMSAAAVAGLALTGAVEAKPRLSGEAELARLLEDRVAGEPVSCLTLSQSRDVQVIDGTALVYGKGRTIYVNRTDFPKNLDSGDILVSKHHGSQVCKMDLIRMRDRSSQVDMGFVSLAEFVPYRRVATASR